MVTSYDQGMTEHGQETGDDTVAAHRWMRHVDPETGEANHWCIDGDTEHHAEPCPDAQERLGDHAGDPADAVWPEYTEQNAAVMPVPE
jgi:hypothetical protein